MRALFLDVIAPSEVDRPGALIALILVLAVFVIVMAVLQKKKK